MANCTEIRVFELSTESRARLGGATEAKLDIPTAYSMRLTKDVEKLSILNKIATEGVLGFSLPSTPTNDAVFLDYASPVTLDNRVKFYRVAVTLAGHAIRFDRLLVKGRNQGGKEWDLELRRSPDHWIELASGLPINEIDFGNFVMIPANITDNWALPVYDGDYKDPDDQKPVYFPLLDFGGWVDQTEVPQGSVNLDVKAVGVADFRPLVSLPYLLRAGFCKIGWTLDGVILDTDWLKRKWVYALKQDYYQASKIGGRLIGRSFTRFQVQTTQSTIIRYFEVVQGNSIRLPAAGSGNLMGIFNFEGVALKFKYKMVADFTNENGNEITVNFNIHEVDFNGTANLFPTGVVISPTPLTVVFAAGETKTVIFEEEIILQPKQRGAMYVIFDPGPDTGFWMESGAFFSVVPTNKSLMYSDDVEISETVSGETNLLDWLKVLVHLCNGRLETDFDTKTLTVHPNKKADVWGETVPGFLLDEAAALDISEQIIVDSIDMTPVRPDLKRYTRLEFAESTDAYIQSLNLTDPAHSRTLLNGLEYPDEIESIQNPIVEPTLEGVPIGLATGAAGRHPLPYLPRLWDNTTGQRSFNIKPRIFHAFGPVRQINPNPISSTDELTSFFFNEVPNNSNTGLVTEFGYATQLPTWKLTPTPAVAGNVVFGKEQYDLFVAFYIGITQDMRGGSILDLLMFMRMKDYIGYDFRRLFAFKYRGVPLRVPMTGIRDFAPCADSPTPVTFFVPPAETECCDLPCGCQFTTCDYYQDFGVFMRQSTLDDMRLTSFMVDGIELVTTPIGFGLLNMVDVGGMPYVMNLIDVLNSVAAPYFSFNLSTRTHDPKGKRFFSLKRLACVPFRIVIEHDGEEVYIYTQDSQQTKWFGSSWEDFGYGGGAYGDPIDFVTTTEY